MENKCEIFLTTSTNSAGANMIQNYLNNNTTAINTTKPTSIENINSLYPHTMNIYPKYISIDLDTLNKRFIIKDVEVIVPEKVVKVTFDDNTFEKAVCHPDDKFDMETAIGICIAKHFCGGSSKYNNLVNKGVKLYNTKVKAEEKAKAEQERIEVKRKKRYEKKLARKNRIEEEKRQIRIREQAEAIKLVYEMLNECDNIGTYPELLDEE